MNACQASRATVLLAVSCLSTQTGAVECAPQWSCACDSLAGKSLVKASVLAIDASSIEIQIEQVLNPNAALGEDAVHEQLSLTLAVSTLSPNLPCTPTNRKLSSVGDSVFVAFRVYAPLDASTLRYGDEALVRPWADTVDLDSGNLLPVSDAATLSDRAACYEKYPPKVKQEHCLE